MIATVQRVSEAKVEINNNIYSEIGEGVLILLCVESEDNLDQAVKMSEKILNFCILEGDSGIMSASLRDLEEDVMIISQFTLAGKFLKGNRPSFVNAKDPKIAEDMITSIVNEFSKYLTIKTGSFGAMMMLV